LDFDPNTPDNIIIFNNEDFLASFEGYELNDGRKNRKDKRIRLNYPLASQRKLLKDTPELRAFNAFYNLPLSVQQYESPAAWAEVVKRKTGNVNYFQSSMYVTLGSQIRDDLDECEIKEKYGLT
jgi:hypothetical protein